PRLEADRIAEAPQRPQELIGTHFFAPANVMRLLEVVRGKQTGKDVLATTLKLGKTLKKLPVVSGVCDGFIGNRMLEKYGQQAMFLLDEGASPQQVDGALTKWGMAMGPFAMYDMAGQDIGWEIRKRRYQERPDFVYSKISDIDMVYLTGYGFPPYRGGPMFYAETVGLNNVAAAIQRFQKGYQGAQWKPALLLVKLAKEGRRFNG